ncbi:MAG: hypothetical protein JO081_02795 [Alphaproteobacteria bacterium]|nr:hypothetical protein [Alphaproteobacteria bacterium]
MDVAQWLRNLNLAEYEAHFRENHVDSATGTRAARSADASCDPSND